MEKKISEVVKSLQEINWDFSDFISTKYPLDLNSIPWYPASFISPIPKLLVASLSNEGDVVLDPFGGKGTTAIETALQNRIPLYGDLNPFATEMVSGLFAALEYVLYEETGLEDEKGQVTRYIADREQVDEIIRRNNINSEIKDWFHEDTILELVAIVERISHEKNNHCKMIQKLAFLSILKSASWQQGHFTYVTDNCKPKPDQRTKKKEALKLYCDKMEQILLAAREFIIQYYLAYKDGNLKDVLKKRRIVTGNAKDLFWVKDDSVDLVVTSPPYLCSQDYIKTMRLMNLFYENKEAFEEGVKQEIGARASRRGKSEIVVPRFYEDLNIVFENINRVLKNGGYFGLVIGQGKSKITAEYNIISDLINMIESEQGFHLVFQRERQIGSRVIQVGGVDKESILIFEKN